MKALQRLTAQQKSELRWFFPETLIYAVLVSAYCWAVFRFLGPLLPRIAHHHRPEYAALALALMVVQGFVLERITHAIITLFRRDPKVAA